MPVDVGPYQFSLQDARATLAHVDDLLDLYPAAAQEILVATRAELHELVGPSDQIDSLTDAALAAAVSQVFPKILSARETLLSSGTVAAAANGVVAQVSASDGGVPKQSVESAEIGFGGLIGDHQAARVHHGRPWQALCLWSTEVIGQLQDEGHPIYAGAAGENITTTGIDWSTIVMGTQLQIGSALVQITAAAVPCAKNAQWFTDRDFSRIHHSNGPISRLYATVISPGVVSVGDKVIVEPDS